MSFTDLRPIRDILAECMRRERLGLVRPLWEDWKVFADDDCEQVRKRADHLIRLLADLGVELVQKGVPAPPARLDSSEIYRFQLAGGKAERLIRFDQNGKWQIVRVEAAESTVEQEFTLVQASLEAGLVLTDAPEARAIQGLGRKLAAALEILRVNAQKMGETA